MTTSPKHRIRTTPSHLIRLPISRPPSRGCAVHGSVAQTFWGTWHPSRHSQPREPPQCSDAVSLGTISLYGVTVAEFDAAPYPFPFTACTVNVAGPPSVIRFQV